MAQSVRSSNVLAPTTQSDLVSSKLDDQQAVEVFPPEIVFKDIETEQIYEVTVCVRNLSKKSRRIRFTPPRTVRFKAKYEHTGPLHSGIATIVIISFETDQLGDYHDEMEISSEDYHFTLPLHAYKPSPDLQFDSFVNLGYTAVGKAVAHTVSFLNRGSVKGEVLIRYDKQLASELTVQPEAFTMEPGANIPVELTYLSREVNTFHSDLQVEVDGRRLPAQIAVTANCVEQQIALVAAKLKEISRNEEQNVLAVITSLDFETMYHGQRKELTAYLVNIGPFTVKYSVKFLPGTEDIMESENYLLMTPQEMATQSIKRPLDAVPSSGEIPAFSQVPIKFVCNSTTRELSTRFVQNSLESKPREGSAGSMESEAMYFYTALFAFVDSEQRLKVQLQARAIYPTVKISHTSVHFNDCPVNESRQFEIELESSNPALPLDFSIPKNAYFSALPAQGTLKPLEPLPVTLSFRPKSLGTFEVTMTLSFLNGSYEVPVLVFGTCSSAVRRPEKSSSKGAQLRRNGASLPALAQSTDVKPSLWRDDRDLSPPLDEAIALLKQNSRRYNEYLRESRSQRLFKKNPSKLAQSQTLPKTLEEIQQDTDFCLSSAPLRTQPLLLPAAQSSLYVEKPLGKYDATRVKNQDYIHDPSKSIQNSYKKITEKGDFEEIRFSERPVKQLEVKECTYALTPFDLKLISAGPKRIDYGDVVIRCPVAKWFSLINDLKQSLFVELVPDIEEIQAIEPRTLVIPAGQKGGFKVILMSTKKQHITSVIKYVLNGKYEFNFMILADVEPAVLELSVPNASEFSLNVPFLFFRFDEMNLSESVSREIVISNKCTADTKFTWVLPQDSNYTVDPSERVVETMRQMKAVIKFTPGVSQKKNDEENLVMKVENGESQSLICKGEVSDANCSFVQKNLDFGVVAVGLKHEKAVTIRNLKPKSTIFYLSKCPPEIEVTPSRGKIAGDAKIPLKVVFCSQTEVEFTGELEIIIRGGRNALQLPITCRVIEPMISIEEDEIDFGGVTVGSHLTRSVTFENDSEIAAVLYLNLEPHPEFTVTVQAEPGEDLDMSTLVPATSDKDCPFYVKEEDEDLEDPRPDPLMDEEDFEEMEEEEPRKFKITIPPDKPVLLQLRYAPKETEPVHFTLPIVLAGVNQTTQGLLRTVTGEGLKPRFYVESSIIDFKKKVISPGEKSFSVYKTFLVSNPEIYPVRWRVDTASIDQKQLFSLKPAEGTLDPGGFLTLRAGFNPLQPISYEEHVNLYLDEAADPYLTFTLQGEGTVPRINFDRRHVLLPVVPLNIQSRCIFQVLNDGYENVELRYEIREDPGDINLKLHYLDGKQLGITKPKITMEVTFQSARPVSFTNIVDFFDQDGGKYSVPISGTADNSLLTTYSFIQRNPDEVHLEVSETGCVTLIQEVRSEDDAWSDKGNNVSRAGPRTAAGSSVVSQGMMSMVGYNPVPPAMLERSLDFLARWLNHVVLTNPVNKLPDDFIATNGAQLYEIITVLSGGKSPPGQVKLAGVPAKEHTKLILKQYTELLAWLKAGGALLNTIRPEFLLSISDYSRYLKSTPELLQFRPRQIERRWPYLSMDSWVTLLYQIIKLYVLAHVTPKSFKSLAGVSPDKATISESMTQSNIYSLQECILLRWLSLHFSNIYPMTSRKVYNFDQDLLDGTVISAVVQSHMGAIGQLSKVKFNPLNDDQRKGNIEKVISALNDSGMPTFLTLRDLIGSFISPREMVLFCITLFQGLPHYIPKCTIEFPCVLGDKVIRYLELTNPSNKQVTYWVRLEGSSDFQLSNFEDLVIAPFGTFNFPVIFQSRIFSTVTGRLRLTNRGGDGSAHAAALVFNLVSKVLSRRSEKVAEIESYLYELVVKEVDITNRFNKDAEFNLQLVYIPKEMPAQPLNVSKANKKHIKVRPLVVFPNPFSIRVDKVKIKKGASASVSVLFHPFELDTQEANLIFVDENVGEIQFTIKGKVKPPRIDKADKFEFKRELGSTSPVEVSVYPKNRLFEKAKNDVFTRLAGATKAKERESMAEIFSNLFEETSVFELVINSPFFSGPTTFAISDINRGKLDASQISGHDSSLKLGDQLSLPKQKNPSRAHSVATAADKVTLLNLGFAPKLAGEYSCQLTMTNRLRTDIRVLDLLVTVLPRKTHITFEMVTQARVPISQEIPIVNSGDKDWNVKVHLSQPEDQLFTVTRDFQVRRRNTGTCVVTFKPEWVCEVKAKLELEVVATNEVHEFELVGKSTEPRAEDHVVLQCRVKERTRHSVKVPNPKSYPVSYKVVSDLRSATGDSTFDVPANSSGDYEFSMYPLQSGSYTGSITFSDHWNHFYWYTVEVHSASPEPEAVKELRVQCRKAVELKITVFNPLPEDTVFDVNVTGEGLFAEPQFAISAKQTEVYTLLYSPLIPGQSDGSVFFLSEKTGEFWYKVRLICEPADPISIDPFECDIGRSTAKPVALDNPSSQEVLLTYLCSNPTNFEIVPSTIILPPYNSLEVLIKYTPTAIRTKETADIYLSSKAIGDWRLHCEGQGVPPSPYEAVIVTAGVGDSSSIQIPFKNPFRDAISATVWMETDSPDIFMLLLKKNKFTVPPFSLLMVPVAFKPGNMEERTAKVLIQAAKDLMWVYPLRGITEKPSYKIDFTFKAKCRTKLQREVQITLPDLPALAGDENFTHELRVVSEDLAPLVAKTFVLQPVKNILQSAEEQLVYEVLFEPLRPFRTDAELLIYKATGGRWRFNLVIEAKEPDLDDTILIESAMGRATAVAFRLTNHFKQYAPFQAYFKEDSDSCFSVRPEKGILEPFGREGTQFVVTFYPSEYGFPKSGKLVIITDEMQWTYIVKGSHPAYKAPEGKRLVDDRLSHTQRSIVAAAQHLSRKNYIRENIEAHSLSPVRKTQDNQS